MAANRKQVLVQFDRDLLARLDNYAAQWCRSNRSRAVAQAVEAMLARHAAYEAAQAPPPFGGGAGGPVHTHDTETQQRNRPLTAELTDLFGGGR